MLEYVLNSGAWSIGGLIVGFLLGRMERQIQDIHDKVENDDNT